MTHVCIFSDNIRFMNTTTRPDSSDFPAVSLNSLQLELAAYYAAMAVMLEDCFKPGAGIAMLGGNAEKVGTSAEFIDMVRIGETVIGAQLPAWHAYAYQGRVSQGLSLHELQMVDGPFPRLKDMLDLLNVDDGYFEDCVNTAGAQLPHTQSHLKDLAERVESRLDLDSNKELTIRQLAVLANMNERSVRNAVTAEGSGKLALNQNGNVGAPFAAQWLSGRRGFVPTVKPDTKGQQERRLKTLSSFEIPHYLKERLNAKWRDFAGDQSNWLVDAANAADMKVARLQEVCSLPFCVRPEEAISLARALDIDPVWLTGQVLWALHPEPMKLVMSNPKHAGDALTDEEFGTEPSVTVVLTEAMLKNGYLALPASAKGMFPDDCMSTRETPTDETAAVQVEFSYGPHQDLTDIRYQSGKTISPRKRFSAWFTRELQARPGDRIRVEKTAERKYKLHFIPK
jgi:hypothetical protein